MFDFIRKAINPSRGDKPDKLLGVLQFENIRHAHLLPEEELPELCEAINRFASEWQAYHSRDIFNKEAPITVVPILVAHAPYYNPGSRETVIQVLRAMPRPIIDEIVYYIRSATSESVVINWPDLGGYMKYNMNIYDCARITAFEALAERALSNDEDRRRAIDFFKTLSNDSNSRIRNDAVDVVNNIEHKIREGSSP